MASQGEYAAAANAIHALANKMISALPFFEQGLASNALNNQVVNQFAKASVDAAETQRIKEIRP
jgi:hypothetical protein